LYKIKDYFTCGHIYKIKEQTVYRVTSLSDILTKIIPHFVQYPLRTRKYKDFRVWRNIALLMQENEHLNISGLNMIFSYYCSLNLGYSKKSKSMVPDSGLVITSDSKSVVEQ
jgi:hypothetical protein